MAPTTPARSLPYPNGASKIAKTGTPEESIRQDFQNLAVATDRELQVEAAGRATLATAIDTLPETRDLISGEDTSMRRVEATDALAMAVAVDSAGNVALGVNKTGAVVMGVPPVVGGADRTAIACIGDSLVRGYTNSTAWNLSEAWPALLAGQLGSGVTVTNLGFGGNPSSEIRMRVSALPVTFTVTGGSIPASGPVTVTTRRKVGLVGGRTTTVNGTLAGVYGTIAYDGTSTWTFTRTSRGTNPTTVTGPVPFIVDRGTDYSNQTMIIWWGRNDVSFNTTGAYGTVQDHVIAADIEMVEWMRAQRKAFLLISVTNRTDEPAGSAKYNAIQEINARRAALFPSHYIDLRSWLVHEAIYEAGITPTQADLDNMAVDAPPPSIMDGGSHYTKPIAPLIAAKLAAILTERGLVL